MRRICFYHAGCPDGFGAAWAVWRAWGESASYVPRGHDDDLRAEEYAGDRVAFVDIAPPNGVLRELGAVAAQVVVLDHHVSSKQRFESDAELASALPSLGHRIDFDLAHSGAVLAWRHFHPGAETPELLRYVEDQDLWSWKLPDSEAVNATIGSHPHTFATWSALAATPVDELAREGVPILRSQQREVETALRFAHPARVGEQKVEAVNALHRRSLIGHELAKRASFGAPFGLVYRVSGERVDVSLYSIGAFDVSRLAVGFGGGGHRNAAGFHVSLREWLERFLD
jgi:hypothetical protein